MFRRTISQHLMVASWAFTICLATYVYSRGYHAPGKPPVGQANSPLLAPDAEVTKSTGPDVYVLTAEDSRTTDHNITQPGGTLVVTLNPYPPTHFCAAKVTLRTSDRREVAVAQDGGKGLCNPPAGSLSARSTRRLNQGWTSLRLHVPHDIPVGTTLAATATIRFFASDHFGWAGPGGTRDAALFKVLPTEQTQEILIDRLALVASPDTLMQMPQSQHRRYVQSLLPPHIFLAVAIPIFFGLVVPAVNPSYSGYPEFWPIGIALLINGFFIALYFTWYLVPLFFEVIDMTPANDWTSPIAVLLVDCGIAAATFSIMDRMQNRWRWPRRVFARMLTPK